MTTNRIGEIRAVATQATGETEREESEMKALKKMALAICGTWLLAATAAAQPDPGVVLERCLAVIEAETTLAVEHLGAITDRTVKVIEARVAEGDLEGAERAAARGKRRARVATRRAAEHLHERVRDCARTLRRLEADDALLEVLRAAGRESVRAMRAAREECVAAIDAAIGGDSDS